MAALQPRKLSDRRSPPLSSRKSATHHVTLVNLLRSRQQQRQQLRTAFAVDDAVDKVGPEAALEGKHGLLLIGHVVAEPLEREQETGVGPIGIDQLTRRARKRE